MPGFVNERASSSHLCKILQEAKVWSYHDAWAAHKMITKLRANLGKHETMRDSELQELYDILKSSNHKRLQALANDEDPPGEKQPSTSLIQDEFDEPEDQPCDDESLFAHLSQLAGGQDEQELERGTVLAEEMDNTDVAAGHLESQPQDEMGASNSANSSSSASATTDEYHPMEGHPTQKNLDAIEIIGDSPIKETEEVNTPVVCPHPGKEQSDNLKPPPMSEKLETFGKLLAVAQERLLTMQKEHALQKKDAVPAPARELPPTKPDSLPLSPNISEVKPRALDSGHQEFTDAQLECNNRTLNPDELETQMVCVGYAQEVPKSMLPPDLEPLPMSDNNGVPPLHRSGPASKSSPVVEDEKLATPPACKDNKEESWPAISPIQDAVSKDEQMKLVGAAKATAKRKAAEKAEKGAGAKAKAKVKAQAKGKAKGSAAKPKATAKGKARPKAAMKRPAAASPDMDAQQPTLAEEEEETPEKVNKNNADKSAASNSRQTCEMSEEVKRLEADGVIPHTFGGRGRPTKGWGLEKYARTAEAFKLHIEPQLEGRTKHKAQVKFCELVQAAKKEGDHNDPRDFKYIDTAVVKFWSSYKPAEPAAKRSKPGLQKPELKEGEDVD
ncbi:unnamed protein product [Effrenium voratum]|uniref:Uncharacterized protein n=1 Tax=Effrenium voratum TaxID=2562239 RepID=A0AA36IKD2_9DINO|nr:unnamed protein product [Effrenium voratum]CAJ1459623.1 unnamed protein product [Effrenium voratum]